MANTKRTLVSAAVAFTMVLMSVAQAMAADDKIKTLVLHVDNYAQVPADLLAAAEKKASSIYATAGISTIWVSGDFDDDSLQISTLHLRVLLLSRDMSDKKIKADRVANGVMGQAAKPTKRAYIFYPRISDLANSKSCLVNDLLGKVLAHEVGHLMLTSGHTDHGIMQAELDLRPNTHPQFTDAQAAAIRGELLATQAAN